MSITIELPPETEAALKEDAANVGTDVAVIVRMLVEKAYGPARKRLPPPGFAAHLFPSEVSSADIVRTLRSEWDDAS